MLTQQQLKDYEDKGGHLIPISRFVTVVLEFVNSYNQYHNHVAGLWSIARKWCSKSLASEEALDSWLTL